MTLSKQIGRPFLVMVTLIVFVFIIKSPIFTWLTPPISIADDYYLNIDDSAFTEYGLVTQVSDGDTITIHEDQEVRMLGMDTPELAHPELHIREECYGKDAKARMEQLVLNKYVYLLKDKKDTDKYKRSLRFVFLADKKHDMRKLFVNGYMVGEGFARAYIFERDEKYKDFIIALQQKALDEKRGLWGKCDREKFRW
jgi:endonuclease YncB( thermonuclease family)